MEIFVPAVLLNLPEILDLISIAERRGADVIKGIDGPTVVFHYPHGEESIIRSQWEQILPLVDSGLTIHDSHFSSAPVSDETLSSNVSPELDNSTVPETDIPKIYAEYTRIHTANNSSEKLLGFGQVDFGTNNWTQPTTHDQLMKWMELFPDWYCLTERKKWEADNTIEEET